MFFSSLKSVETAAVPQVRATPVQEWAMPTQVDGPTAPVFVVQPLRRTPPSSLELNASTTTVTPVPGNRNPNLHNNRLNDNHPPGDSHPASSLPRNRIATPINRWDPNHLSQCADDRGDTWVLTPVPRLNPPRNWSNGRAS